MRRVNARHPALGLVCPFPPIRNPASRLVLRVAQVAGLGELQENRGKATANAAASCAPRVCGEPNIGEEAIVAGTAASCASRVCGEPNIGEEAIVAGTAASCASWVCGKTVKTEFTGGL